MPLNKPKHQRNDKALWTALYHLSWMIQTYNDETEKTLETRGRM